MLNVDRSNPERTAAASRSTATKVGRGTTTKAPDGGRRMGWGGVSMTVAAVVPLRPRVQRVGTHSRRKAAPAHHRP